MQHHCQWSDARSQENMDWDIYTLNQLVLIISAASVTSVGSSSTGHDFSNAMFKNYFICDLFPDGGGLLSKYGCEGELVKIDCDSAGLVIDIVRANYGRLSPSVCPGPGAASDCLHRSTKAVLDRRCGGGSSCVLRASQETFSGAECPGVSQYLEIHFRCVPDRQRAGARGSMVPPWLQDLHATFRPATLGSTAAPPSASDESNESDNDDAPDDDEALSTVISEDPQSSQNSSAASPNSQGRYFLIHDHVGESVESDEDTSMTTLVVSVTVSIISTILSVLIIVHICRKVRAKPLPLAPDSDEACYQCTSTTTNTYQLDKLSSLAPVPVIPVQNIIYAPVSDIMAPLSPPRDSLGPDPDTNVIYR